MRSVGEPSRESIRFPESEFDTFASDFAHQWRTFEVCGRRIRLRINECVINEEIEVQPREALHFGPSIRQVLEEDGDIVVRIRARLSKCARAEQHHAVETVAIQRIQRLAETDEYWVV